MLVKNKIKQEWYSNFIKNKDKSYFKNYEYDLNVSDFKDFKEFFKISFELERMKVIEFLFPQIQAKKIVSNKLQIGTFNDDDYRKGFFGIKANGEIPEFSRITSLVVEEYGVFKSKDSNNYSDIYLTDTINESEFKLQLNYYNQLSGAFNLTGEFRGDYQDYSMLEWNDIGFHCKLSVNGLLKNTPYPSWIEYIIDSVINYNNKDYKMNVLNLYSAFENFITTIHDKFIFEHLAHKTGKNIKDIDNLRSFSQERKRLFLKVEQIIDFLGLSKLKEAINNIEKYETDRHRIAHGAVKNNELSNIDYIDMLYSVVFVILSVSTNSILDTDEWLQSIKRL